jgi:VRR-NUC domain-containing protein
VGLGDFLISIPNGGYRHKSEAVRLKKEGLKKGVCDLFLAIPSYDGIKTEMNIRRGLWIEVKSKKGKLSNYQKEWIKLMRQYCGYSVSVVRSVDEGIQAIKDYLGMR